MKQLSHKGDIALSQPILLLYSLFLLETLLLNLWYTLMIFFS